MATTKRWGWGLSILAALGATFGATEPAEAFCGFYVAGADAKLFNNATLVVLMRDGTKTVLSMQNNYQGPPESFAMVVPVPVVLHKEDVKTLGPEIFDRVDKLAAPRLVEYWERDPCEPDYDEEMKAMAEGAMPTPDAADGGGVKVEAQFQVGEYDVVILSASDSGGLDRWLKANHYNIPAGAEPLFRPYVEEGSKFFVAKVDVSRVKFDNGQAMLSPLRVHYDSPRFALPVRLGLINAQDKQDLIVHILAKQRYEVANYPNVTIPTNLDLDEQAKREFGSFYAKLFDRTVERNPKAVVTEYAWDAGTCDPCPSPALDQQEIATLGGDVLQIENPWGMVLTRLHARYDKGSLGEDLVFKEAPPIAGGREFLRDTKLETGSVPAPQNNFQGRYAIRHPWTGPIACESPIRGRWGGPPNGDAPVQPATDLAFAPRGGTKLASYVEHDVAEIGLKAAQATVDHPGEIPRDVPAVAASAEPTPTPAPATTPSTTPPTGGCGSCEIGAPSRAPGAPLAWVAALLGLTSLRRRRG